MKTIGGDEVSLVQSQREEQVKLAATQAQTWSLQRWEEYLNAINPNFMELGLQRIDQVAQRLEIPSLLKASQTRVVTVAGTNGKGSTCALISQAMTNLGLKVGLYTSPHLLRFNERIQINSQEIDDATLCQCLYQVICAQVSPTYIDLSYFEIITLAAWLAFIKAKCQVWVLEVGLGGRLDAVNLLEHQVSIITSIGLDHMKILGDTVEKIAFEKAGIIHTKDYTILGQNIPEAACAVIKQVASKQHATLQQELVDFKVEALGEALDESLGKASDKALSASCVVHQGCNGLPYKSGIKFCSQLVSNASAKERTNACDLSDEPKHDSLCKSNGATACEASNAAVCKASSVSNSESSCTSSLAFSFPRVPFICTAPALQAVFYLMQDLGLEQTSEALHKIDRAVSSVALPGRMQLVQEQPAIYLDVAHNVPAAAHLKDELRHHLAAYQRKLAVIGMLKDKDVEGVLKILKDSFDAFYVASLHVPRGESQERLVAALQALKPSQPIFAFDTVSQALAQAQKDAGKADVIMVVGSFVTVAEAQQALKK